MGPTDHPEQVEITTERGVVWVKIRGNLVGESELSSVAEIRAERVVLDLDSLIRMTSRGIVIWMRMIEELCSNVPTVEIKNAPHGFIQHYVMIEGFAATARIESIRATFACDRCDRQQKVTLERSSDFPDGRVHPKRTPWCDACQEPMVPDDILFEHEVSL